MVTFKQSDLAELKDPCSYLSDVIIEFYFTYLSSVHPSDSILYVPPSISFILSNAIDDGVVEDCLKSLELPSKNLIFFTVYRCKHWSLLVYHRESNRFVHHDSSMTGMNDDAARELYMSVEDCVHENRHRIKSRKRRFMDGPRYVGSQMWPEENNYNCGSRAFPQHMDGLGDDSRYLGSQMWPEENDYYMDGLSDDPRYLGSQMWPEENDYNCGSRAFPRHMDGLSDDPRYLGSQMWPEENDYDCGSRAFPLMWHRDGLSGDPRYVGSQMYRDDYDCGSYGFPRNYDRGSYGLPRMRRKISRMPEIFRIQREKNEHEDDCGLEGPQMRRENNDYDDSRFSDDYDRGLYDAFDCGSSVSPQMHGEKKEYAFDCGSSVSPQMRGEKKEYDRGSYITPRMRREKDEYDYGLWPRMQREKNEYGDALFICPKTPQQKNGFDCGLHVMAIAEAICRWFCEENEEKDWIEKINDIVDDNLVSSMRTRVLELIRDASVGILGTVSCTIEGERSVGVSSSNSDVSKELERDDDIVVTIGGLSMEETEEVVDNFWEDLNWSSDDGTTSSRTISDRDVCDTISEGLPELIVEEGENDCRTLCGGLPPSVAVGKMVDSDSAPPMEEETANEKVSTEFRTLVREEAVDKSGMIEPSLSCDLTSASSCIVVEENKPVKDADMSNCGTVENGGSGLKTEDTGDVCGNCRPLNEVFSGSSTDADGDRTVKDKLVGFIHSVLDCNILGIPSPLY